MLLFKRSNHRDFVFLLLITGFFAVSSFQGIGQPAWVTNFPQHPDYYTGVGVAEKKPGSSQYIQMARDQALEQIASGIAVTITSEASQRILEQAGIVKESFKLTVISMTRAELQGYELVDTWENENEYWVYYRLNKKQYHLWLDKRKQVASIQAFEYFTQAENALGRKEITPAIGFYLQALNEIAPYMGMGLRAPNGSPDSFLEVKLLMEISRLFSSIRINSLSPTLHSKVFQAPSGKIKLEVVFFDQDGSRIPVRNFPLSATILQGNCTFDKLFPTDSSGISPLKISRVNAPGNIQIAIRPDLSALMGASHRQGPQFLETLIVPEEIVSVLVDPVRVLIISSEFNMDVQQHRSITQSAMRQFLTGNGWSIVNEARLADYVMAIHARTRKGTQRQGIHTAFASGEIVLTDNVSQQELKSKVFPEVNAGGNSFEEAGIQALNRLAEEMSKKLEGWFD